MSSDNSEWASLVDISTPTISVTESAGNTSHPEQHPNDRGIDSVENDLSLGIKLLQVATQGFSEASSDPGADRCTMLTPPQEIVPDKTGARLESNICHVSVGPAKVLLKAHQEVLEQSPVFAAILKHKLLSNHDLRIELPDQEPALFRRVLNYLYDQKLPVAASEESERLGELVDGYIMACRLELNILQHIILQALGTIVHDVDSDALLSAAADVYKADQARPPFQKFFAGILENCIEEEGFRGAHRIGRVLKKLVFDGGLIAIDICEAFEWVHAQAVEDKSCELKLRAQIQDATRKISELESRIRKSSDEKMAANDRTPQLRKLLSTLQKEKDPRSRIGERTEATLRDLESVRGKFATRRTS